MWKIIFICIEFDLEICSNVFFSFAGKLESCHQLHSKFNFNDNAVLVLGIKIKAINLTNDLIEVSRLLLQHYFIVWKFFSATALRLV